MRFVYPAVISKTENGRYRAVFPDLEMCEAEGDSIVEVQRNAVQAAYDWIDLELHEEDPLLPPSTDKQDIRTCEGETVCDILVIYRMHEGWDE